MKLFVLSSLICAIKGCGSDLSLEAKEISKIEELKFDEELASSWFKRLDYKSIYSLCLDLNFKDLIPPEEIGPDFDPKANKKFLEQFYYVSLQLEVIEGSMICKKCGRKYPIKMGTLDFRLNEVEANEGVSKKKQLKEDIENVDEEMD